MTVTYTSVRYLGTVKTNVVSTSPPPPPPPPPAEFYSVYFDGTGDSITFPGISLSGDFAVECWIYITALESPYSILFSSSNNVQFVVGGTSNTGKIALYDGGGFALNFTSAAVTSNNWHHIAWTRSGTDVRGFVDGVQVGSGTSNRNIPISIFGSYISGGYEFNGYVSNLRIVNGSALYTSNFTPSTQPLTAITNTSLLTAQSSTIIDNSGNNVVLTVNGNTRVDELNPF